MSNAKRFQMPCVMDVIDSRSDPLLYDRCIRRFQSAAEREADGKARGYSGVLEADLYRSEAKLAALKKVIPDSSSSHAAPSSLSTSKITQSQTQSPSQSQLNSSLEDKIKNVDSLLEEEEDVPKTKEEGLERWKWEMTMRFLKGEDPDFEYEPVDGSTEWDDEVEARDDEEKWFDEEEPEWMSSSGDDNDAGSVRKERIGTGGETGIQDF